MKKTLLPILSGFLAGLLGAYLFLTFHTPSQDQLIKEFYEVETAASVSPHHIRKDMAKSHQDFILVDLRSQEEYEKEHVTGAFSIPAYATPDKSAYGDVERIVGSFRELKAQHPDKKIIVYCYSIPCMTGRKIGKMLADHGIYVKHLGVGWNEWRYHWTLWNHPHEWEQTKVEDYISTGEEPGEFAGKKDDSTFCLPGEFGC